ncbi:MAG: NAD-dependent epimerase/dehydratase family protein [Roseiflexaceae bacterium]
MKILLIGGTGLISSAITRELVARDDEVTHYNRGKSAPEVAGVRTIVGDRTDHAAFERQIGELGSFDCVIDMVGFKPEDAESLTRACRGRAGHVIFCSTVDVYTKPAARYPIHEDGQRAPSPSFPYAYDKAICEQTLEAAHQRGDFPLTIIRPAFTYGEGRGMIHSFGGSNTYLDRLRKGKPIIVHGDGSSLWVACHRDDVAHTFAAAAGSQQTCGRAYNVTGEEWMTWNQYHCEIAAAIGAPAPTLVHIPTDLLLRAVPKRAWITAENFQFNNIFDTSAAQRDLGFEYRITLAEGTRRIMAWLDRQGNLPNSDDDPFEDQLIAAWERLGDDLSGALSEA